MLLRLIIGGVSIAMLGSAIAQFEHAPRGSIPLPGTPTPGVLDAAALPATAGLPAPAVLAWIGDWLSANFDLPAVPDLPGVRRAPPGELLAIRFGHSHLDLSPCVADGCRHAAVPEFEHGIVALYHDATRTIFLPEDWTGTTPAEFSVLVHEMVHHLQNLGGVNYECAEARERPAFAAQARWLELFGQTLESEFSMDGMTLLVRTTCPR